MKNKSKLRKNEDTGNFKYLKIYNSEFQCFLKANFSFFTINIQKLSKSFYNVLIAFERQKFERQIQQQFVIWESNKLEKNYYDSPPPKIPKI